jgi:anti-sigma factor RsiW
MARCEDIELLLGPFEDGELEPHEMQEVARHTATCPACDLALAGYRTIAVALRGSQPIPALEGFATGVMARIQSMHLPPPVPETRWHWYDTVTGWFTNTVMMGGLAAAVAIVTAIVVTPEAAKLLHMREAHAQKSEVVASIATPVQVSKPAIAAPPINNVASNDEESDTGGSGNQVVAAADNSGDAGTEISSLQSDNPSVAVWTSPNDKTTVVWVPDQQP